MSDKKKAIFIGDYKSPKWHPANDIENELCKILHGYAKIDAVEDYGGLRLKDLSEYDLCINYVDCWDDKASKKTVAAFLCYVAQGGGMLTIHNGILQGNHELNAMHGGKFLSHPKYTSLSFEVTEPSHPIMEGIGPFEMEEEPYRFELDPLTEKTMLMQYRYEDKLWPAAWAIEHGKGRVCYLFPGHTAKAFQHKEYAKMILNGAKWVAFSI